MTFQTYELITYVAFVLAALCFIISVILFTAYNIPSVVNDITGKTARKSIENIRRNNEESGNKAFKPSSVNIERGKLTEKISEANHFEKNITTPLGIGVGTSRLADENNNETTVLNTSNVSELSIEVELTFIHTNEIID